VNLSHETETGGAGTEWFRTVIIESPRRMANVAPVGDPLPAGDVVRRQQARISAGKVLESD
jgi:hypothetical protein